MFISFKIRQHSTKTNIPSLVIFIYYNPELKLITRPTTSTTPTPYVYTTAKPRRKQHQNHNHKSAHDTTNRIREIVLPNNLKENDIIGPGAASSNDGKFSYELETFFLANCLNVILDCWELGNTRQK